jgi:hypothetical protein
MDEDDFLDYIRSVGIMNTDRIECCTSEASQCAC